MINLYKLDIDRKMRKILFAFILFILPLILIGIGALLELYNALYYVLSIVWFGTGLIFYSTMFE